MGVNINQEWNSDSNLEPSITTESKIRQNCVFNPKQTHFLDMVVVFLVVYFQNKFPESNKNTPLCGLKAATEENCHIQYQNISNLGIHRQRVGIYQPLDNRKAP